METHVITNAKSDWIEIVANMNKHKGKHWTDLEKRAHFMELYDKTFIWNADTEFWSLYKDGGTHERN